MEIRPHGIQILFRDKPLVAALSNVNPQLKDKIIMALTNTQDPPAFSVLPDEVTSARAIVKATIEVAGSIDELFASTRANIRYWFSVRLGVAEEQVILTFLPGSVLIDARVLTLDPMALGTYMRSPSAL